VGISTGLGRSLRAAARALLRLGAPLLLAACATNGYAGLALSSDSEIRALGRRALAGDERAQLELGVRFEEGRGVPADLDRARELYFDAATRPSRDRIVTYVATPGGAAPSIVRSMPHGLEYSGNAEALLRWHRLLPRLGRDAAQGRQVGGSTAAPSQLHGDDPESRRAATVRLYAYQPLYLGLESAGPWEAAIAAPTGYAIFSARAIDDTLLMILDRSGPNEPGLRPDSAAAHSLCNGLLRESSPWARAQVRLFALCLARSVGEADELRSEGIARARTALAGDSAGAETGFPHAAMDRIMLFRAGQFCGCAGEFDPQLIAAAADILARSSPDGPRAGDYVQTWASLVLARLESPRAAVWSDAAVGRALDLSARGLRLRLYPFASQNVDEVMVSVCAELGLSYADCRPVFHAGPMLPARVVLIVSDFIAATHPLADRCAALRREMGQIAGELGFRPDIAATLSRFRITECNNEMTSRSRRKDGNG
jgi:hypothetical protein